MDRYRPGDTRGIVDPGAMLRVVDFARFPPGDALEGIVEWFWSVSWDLPAGEIHDQQVINHPAGNISIGTVDDAGVALDPAEGRVYGVHQGLSSRHLTGRGWTVAARTTVGGLGVLLDRPARAATDRQLDLDDAIPGLSGDVVAEVNGAPTNPERVEALRRALARVVDQRAPDRLAEARRVVALTRRIEEDRTICRIEHLARLAGVSTRTLQRLFDHHVGASPSFVIRRWRIIEAAEAARRAIDDGDRWEGWATLAADLGYADQAHLVRDFGRHLGVSPSAYVDRNRIDA